MAYSCFPSFCSSGVKWYEQSSTLQRLQIPRRWDQQWHSNHNLYLGHSLWGLNTSILQTALVPTAFIKKDIFEHLLFELHCSEQFQLHQEVFVCIPSHLLFHFKYLWNKTWIMWYLKHKRKFGSTQNTYPILNQPPIGLKKKKKFQYILNSILQVNWNARERCVWTRKYILRQTIKD